MRHFQDQINNALADTAPVHARPWPDDLPSFGPQTGHTLEQLASADRALADALKRLDGADWTADDCAMLRRLGRGEWTEGRPSGPVAEALDALADAGKLERNSAGWFLAKNRNTRRLLRLFTEATRRAFPMSDLFQSLPL